MRIRQYGVTPDRYMGVLWIFLEIIYLIIYFTMHRYAGRMSGVIAIAVIVALVLPGVNMFSVSISSQERILSQYKKEAELSEEAKEKIYGAYEYLLDVPNSEKYIEDGEYYVNIDSYYMEHYQINLDDNKVLIISDFEIEYDKETEKVEDLSLTVYLFQ